ncbi:AbgT family transporter [Haliangium ochraceum]|uniref:AbgT putative transporter n=1 Tax=Haliangium ochraceum (strain DSM 14365 / JCM 11303 / SMP-2) TaxID=502025 RepID=D0LZ20_HALO1|nr:AbgT family transporter [Haliangium ochraceum]ACY14490.1 AbgT putative transporter [Haliangium ochraceum DSM 14365]
MSDSPSTPRSNETPRLADKVLSWIEAAGNKLPDPAVIFVIAMLLVWIASALLDGHAFEVPAKDGIKANQIVSQLGAEALTTFFAEMVHTFTSFHPLGVVLVALLGVGVAESSGFINACLKGLLSFTPKALLTPMVIFVGILSHTAADAGYVLVIPLGGVIFYAAGRHPLAGIAAAFAGVSGGFSANPIPSAIDPLLQGLTQEAAGILDPAREVNPLCNWWFMAASSILIVGLGWLLTDKVVEPRLRANAEIDGDPEDMPTMESMTSDERRGMWAGLVAMFAGVATLVLLCLPSDSPLRAPDGDLTAFQAPLMQMIVPLIFLVFLVPGIVHGYVSKTFESHRDIIKGMSKTMSTMGYYMVMAFFASLFIYSFGKSQIGALLAVEGANILRSLALPGEVTLFGIVLLCAAVNLLIGSASAKWALLAPIFVPMLMQLGISPELTQAAYRVGDSTTNIITPLMPYFPLVVAFSQRYVKKTGIGTLTAAMLPYSITFLIAWSVFLVAFWLLGIPLGIQGVYAYP